MEVRVNCDGLFLAHEGLALHTLALTEGEWGEGVIGPWLMWTGHKCHHGLVHSDKRSRQK